MEQDFDIKHWSNPCPKYDCRKDLCKCGLKYVNIPVGLENEFKPAKGAYCNAIVEYEANGDIYMYSKEGIPVLLNKVTCDCPENCDCPEEEIINLSAVFDDDSWGFAQANYSVGVGSAGRTIIGTVALSSAQGNPGLFVNDDTGEFVTIEQAYKMIESGKRVKFNHVPVGQYLTEPHTYTYDYYGDCFDGIELTSKYNIDIDGAPLTSYSGVVFKLGLPPLGVYIQKLDQDEQFEDKYEFYIQGQLYNVEE